MNKYDFIPLSVPYINGNEWNYVKDCLDTGWVSSAGKYVNLFEEKINAYTGSKYSVACVNGTSALHISLILSGVGRGDEVIVPTVTFIAPVNAVRYCGAEPVFMDCDDFLNIDVEKIKEFFDKECTYKNCKLVNKNSKRQIKAIIPVHVFGNPVDIEPLVDLARKYKIKIIEDATESLGSRYIKGEYKCRHAGTIGDFGCLSFNGNKIITCGGGGMILTNDKKMAQRARYLTTQAKDDEARFIHCNIGYNYRLTNITAALGLAQLEKIDKYVRIKRNNFNIYKKNMEGVTGLSFIAEPDYGFSNFWFYSLLVEPKAYGLNNLKLMDILTEANIQSRPLWYLNHRQSPYRACRAYKIEKAVSYSSRVLNLPCSVDLDSSAIEKVSRVVIAAAKRK